MDLSVQLIEQVAAMLRGHRQDSREKRGQPRVGLRVRTRIKPVLVDDVGPKCLDVWVRDLSVGGLGVTSHYPLPSGTLFVLSLPNGNAENVDLQYRVMHSRQVGLTSVWLIGAKFDRLLTPLAVPQNSPIAVFARRLAS